MKLPVDIVGVGTFKNFNSPATLFCIARTYDTSQWIQLFAAFRIELYYGLMFYLSLGVGSRGIADINQRRSYRGQVGAHRTGITTGSDQ